MSTGDRAGAHRRAPAPDEDAHECNCHNVDRLDAMVFEVAELLEHVLNPTPCTYCFGIDVDLEDALEAIRDKHGLVARMSGAKSIHFVNVPEQTPTPCSNVVADHTAFRRIDPQQLTAEVLSPTPCMRCFGTSDPLEAVALAIRHNGQFATASGTSTVHYHGGDGA